MEELGKFWQEHAAARHLLWGWAGEGFGKGGVKLSVVSGKHCPCLLFRSQLSA